MVYLDNYSFADKTALVRVDFNVPLKEENGNFKITDDTRLKAALPTLKKILNDGGKIVLMSHLGRPKNQAEYEQEGKGENKYSLKHIVEYLKQHLDTEVKFVEDITSEKSFEESKTLKKGEVLLLENVRFYKAETKTSNENHTEFAKNLAHYGDVYVNDAFGTAHRKHASTATVAEFFDKKDRVCGYVMQQELENAKKVLGNPERPFVAIMGGAKISDKIMVIEKLLDKVDALIIGGGMSYTFFKAEGGKIGSSLVEEDKLTLASELLKKAKEKNVKIYLPKDSLAADKFDNNANTKLVDNTEIPDGFMGLDIGKEAQEEFANVLKNAKTIMWNGPMGVFEMSSFAQGTQKIAETVVEATKNGAYSLIGGGDSAAAINQMNAGDKVSYVSTGGGALLEYLEGKELPGVTALEG
ncbi:3-phosphoglycerate kinase [Bernardetia litoralis DSM 6794]|uniref:Phosphoglycerate kinase n=1 Tax=Bernardetia litoralis (strain ATCC 23117 / DSM 6794 / NBRC 15988 / NCIMB 1366 / Fx l1 / Sio-4) TaxID=880071 RepID=I4AKK8_BERLS|nr:phosphoglycerate kinase [Bernardetia litoralis]AFM04493.1 3-phosphoglycerate kinase [Bernardetia litoralis DSM 6794]